MKKVNIKLERTLRECESHLLRLNSAYSKMQHFMPLTAERYEKLTEDEIEHIDQYLYRFSKLQDTIGERLFKFTLDSLGENTAKKSFIDIFNKLEQLDIVSDYDIWAQLREIRNELTHEYVEDAGENAVRLNKIYKVKDRLALYFEQIMIFLKN